ncbi:MAG: AMP-binding protein [Desulfobacteraceae bacterium]|jgi:acyl-CoA synthetase (AMP-forming)/AMP-acid ligase II|nr:AMP-binding protein [Desulfobacteraceae bacterium]
MDDPYALKPWLKHYDDHVPRSLDYSDKTYAELFREATTHIPTRTAVYYMGRGITYHELDRLSNRFAHFLKKNGLQPGDTVGVNLPNIPAYYISIIGIQKAGCVLTGVSPLLQPKELEYQLNDSGTKLLVTLDALFEKVKGVVPQTGVKTVAVVGIADFLSPLKAFLGKLFKKIPTGKMNPITGTKVGRLMNLLQKMPSDFTEEKRSPGDPCLMQYTGGTTGPPKGAVLTHKNMVSQIQQTNTWLDISVGEEGTILSAFPLFHQAGLFLAMDTMAFGGTQVAVPNPRDLDFLISAIKKFKPKGIVNVPTIYLELLKKPRFRSLDFSGVEWFISGAAPFPPEYIKDFEGVVGKGKLIEVLGMTETSPVHMGLPFYGMKKPGSVGIPFPDTEVKLIDPDSGEIVPVGEPGELTVKGPQVFTEGYHNKPGETATTLRDGWIYTGDILKMDADGYFYVVDRLKDMVIVSGYKVFTRTVDDVLMEHPDIDMAAAIGLPDPTRPGSEIVATAVVLKPGVEKSEDTREKIARYMREKVAPYKVPRKIEFMDELPLSAVGKVLKRELREMMKA